MKTMRLLLDENIPRKLNWRFHSDLKVQTVPECGWSGMTKGDLLLLADDSFDIFLTMDRGLEYQQNVESLNLSILLLSAPSNTYEGLLPIVPQIQQAMTRVEPGSVIRIAG